MKLRSMKLRIYLVLMVTAMLIPVSLFSAVALNMLLRAEREAALRGVRETARATALAVDRELGNAETALHLLATSRNLTDGDWPGFYQQAMVADPGEGAWTVLLDDGGRQIINTSVPFGTALSPAPMTEPVQRVMEAQKTQVSNLMVGPLTQQHIVALAVPVPVYSGKRYVLAQTFTADYFKQAFAHRNIPSSWIVGVADRNGVTISRSRHAAQFAGTSLRPEILAAARTSKEGEVRNFSCEGVDNYTVFTRSAISDWIVAVGVPAKEIESAARRAVIVAGLGLLAALACAVGLATVFGRRLARSMAGAMESAAALGRGEVPPSARSRVAEVDRLHTALTEAGAILMHERDSRALAEAERARLLVSEQEARMRAEEQNKAKDEFLAMLGHELRNPLNAITAAISVMEVDGIGAEKVERAQSILRRQSRHLGRIVDDLLDVSRVMSGKIFLAPQRIDLAEAVRESLATLTATGAAQEHVVTLHAESAWVDADPTRIEQIISNLLVNAFRYTPAGGRIDIDMRADVGTAVLTVRDSGVGMAEELLSKVFDVFVQGPAQLDRSEGGLGIGLALVQRLVALHGGTVTAQSDGAGQGSVFTVRLPLAAMPSGSQKEVSDAAHTAKEACRILLVEDNDDSRQTLSTVLAMRGHRVVEAGDGVDGVRIALAEQPDVAVIDIGLPGIDGYEVARRVRAAGNRRIGLIALTGYGQAEDKQRALSAGFDMHLTKPIEPQRLLDAIAKVHRK
jgi:signal transduction histidine kinase/ActR/RegA family two-component response regulator